MILAEDLTDRMGRLLIAKGTVLTEKHLKICKIWGVVEAQIEGVSDADIDESALNELDPQELAQATEFVHERFQHADMEHPAVRELVRLSILRTVKNKNTGPDSIRQSFQLKIEEENTEGEETKPANINPLKFISEHTKLSTLPDIYNKFVDTIARPNSSSYDIENVINKDTSLSAQLLKISNSAFYSYPAKVDTISRAINIIGTQQLSTLAMGIIIIGVFNKMPARIINMEMFWKHSILCGICARILAGYKNIQNTERLFTAGLLHDIGRLVCYNYLPQESLRAILEAQNDRQLLYLKEREVFDMDHAMIGGSLVNRWQMPLSLEEMVCYHHEPQKSKNSIEPSILHIADIIANAMGIGTSGERLIPPLHEEAWTRLGLSSNILSLIMEQADNQLEDVFKVIYADDKLQQK
ncbi:MAG: HDOD domain-containing protein [Smithella sp.]